MFGMQILIETVFFGQSVPGYPSLVVGLMVLGGVQLIMIGIMGEYIGKILSELKRGRPISWPSIRSRPPTRTPPPPPHPPARSAAEWHPGERRRLPRCCSARHAIRLKEVAVQRRRDCGRRHALPSSSKSCWPSNGRAFRRSKRVADLAVRRRLRHVARGQQRPRSDRAGRLNATSVMVAAPSLHRSEAVALKVLNSAASRVAIRIARDADSALPAAERGRSEPVSEGAFLPLAMTLREAFRRRLRRDALAADARQAAAPFRPVRPAPDFIDGHQALRLFPQISGALLGSPRAPNAWLRQCGRAVALSERFGDRKGSCSAA